MALESPQCRPGHPIEKALDRRIFAFSCEILGVQTPVGGGDRVSWTILEGRFGWRSPFGAPFSAFTTEKGWDYDLLFGFDPQTWGRSVRARLVGADEATAAAGAVIPPNGRPCNSSVSCLPP